MAGKWGEAEWAGSEAAALILTVSGIEGLHSGATDMVKLK